MVLLSSSTVSVVLTSGVVSVFTILLFLSGYILQQQSVRSIQHALHAPLPNTGTSAGGELLRSGDSAMRRVKRAGDQAVLLSDSAPQSAEVGRAPYLAYLQLLATPDPSDICSAIVFFKHLHQNGTAVQDKLFVYPQHWDLLLPHQLTEPVSTALSLLRSASIKYNIWLLPIDMSAATSAGYAATDTKLLRLGQIQFMQYDSVLYVRTPGMLLDAAKLDQMLLSRPLPMKHDRARPDSYNNEAWIPMPLRPDRDAAVPPVYLIAVNPVAGHVEARGHVPNTALTDFGDLVVGPEAFSRRQSVSNRQGDGDGGASQHSPSPAYVYFDTDEDGYPRWKDNPLFGAWRAQQYEECPGLDFDRVSHHEDRI